MRSMQDRLKSVYDLFSKAAQKAKEVATTRRCGRCQRRFKRLRPDELDAWAKQTTEERAAAKMDYDVEQYCSRPCAIRSPLKCSETRQKRRREILQQSHKTAFEHYPYPATRRTRRAEARDVARTTWRKERNEKAQAATA